MSKNRFNIALHKQPKRNGDTLFISIKALYFLYENLHTSEDLRSILFMLKTLERRNMILPEHEKMSMFAIVDKMREKYAALYPEREKKSR